MCAARNVPGTTNISIYMLFDLHRAIEESFISILLTQIATCPSIDIISIDRIALIGGN